METVSINTENSRTNESTKFFYSFTNELNLKNRSKNNVLVNFSN